MFEWVSHTPLANLLNFYLTDEVLSLGDSKCISFQKQPSTSIPQIRFHCTKNEVSIKDFFSKSTEEIVNGKLHFLCSVLPNIWKNLQENTFIGVLILVKLQAWAGSFTKNRTQM